MDEAFSDLDISIVMKYSKLRRDFLVRREITPSDLVASHYTLFEQFSTRIDEYVESVERGIPIETDLDTLWQELQGVPNYKLKKAVSLYRFVSKLVEPG